jgi:hypothetical protein
MFDFNLIRCLLLSFVCKPFSCFFLAFLCSNRNLTRHCRPASVVITRNVVIINSFACYPRFVIRQLTSAFLVIVICTFTLFCALLFAVWSWFDQRSALVLLFNCHKINRELIVFHRNRFPPSHAQARFVGQHERAQFQASLTVSKFEQLSGIQSLLGLREIEQDFWLPNCRLK